MSRTHVIAADHPCLAGHFPGNPVVPAVVLLECVARDLAATLGAPVRVTGVPAAKFLSPLAPAEAFTVEWQLEPAGNAARFRCLAGSRELANGRLEYAHDR